MAKYRQRLPEIEGWQLTEENMSALASQYGLQQFRSTDGEHWLKIRNKNAYIGDYLVMAFNDFDVLKKDEFEMRFEEVAE